MRRTLNEPRRNEKGQALVLVLCFLILGGLTIAPLLAYMSTGINAGQLHKEKMVGSYAADAGVELALWNLTIGELEVPEGGQVALPQFTINTQTLDVTIDNIDDRTYKITSTAASDDGSGTTIESYVNFLVAHAVTSTDTEAIVTVRQSAVIDGDIYYVGEIEIIDDATVNGEIIADDPFDIGIDPEEYKVEAQSGGTHYGDLTIDSSPYTLGPLYITGKLTIQNGVNIILGGTVYVEGQIVIGDDVTITGTGNLLAANHEEEVKSIDIKRRVTIDLENLPLIMSASSFGEIRVGDECDITGLIYNTGGRVHVHAKGPSYVYGALIGKGIRVCEDAIITYNPDLPRLAPYAWRILTWQTNPQ